MTQQINGEDQIKDKTLPFLGLSQVPSSFSGEGGKVLLVNQSENAITFFDYGSFDAANFEIYDTLDFTKVVNILVTGVSTATTRTLSVPDGDGVIALDDGWIPVSDTWTYASASTFTVSGNHTGTYNAGLKLKWEQTTVKYGAVESSSYSAPSTTVTIITNDDYPIANATISNNFISRIESPDKYPHVFNFTPSINNVTIGNGNLYGEYYVQGNLFIARIDLILGSTSSITGSIIFDAPTTAIQSFNSARNPIGIAVQRDTGSNVNYLGNTVYNTTVNKISPQSTSVTGSKVTLSGTNATSPFTWADTDELSLEFQYSLI